MGYTPVELRHVHVGRRPLGYDRAAVQKILDDVADSFETVWRDRGDLADKVEALEHEIEDLRHREQVLTNTLVAAERAAEEMKERAKRDAELIVAEAHGEARTILRAVQADRERLFAESKRIESLLRSALAVVAEAGAVTAAPEVAVAEPEPAREEAREFPVGVPAPPEEVEEPADEPESVEQEQRVGWPRLRKVAQGRRGFDWGE